MERETFLTLWSLILSLAGVILIFKESYVIALGVFLIIWGNNINNRLNN